MIEQLYAAANLMFVGMLVVFVFLSLVIASIKGISALVLAVQDKQETFKQLPAKELGNNRGNSAASVPQHIVAAITAAVHTHQQK